MSQQKLSKLWVYLAWLDALFLRFVMWWWQELASLLSRIYSVKQSGRFLDLSYTTSALRGFQESSKVDLPSFECFQQICQQVQPHVQRMPLFISLPEEAVLLLQYTFPAAVAHHFKKTIEYKLATDSPIDTHLMLFDAYIDHHLSSSSSIVVKVALTRKALVEQLVAESEANQLMLAKIGYAAGGADRLDYVFFISDQKRQSEQSLRWVIYLSVCLILLLMLFFPATILLSKYLTANLHKQVDTLLSADLQHQQDRAHGAQVSDMYQQLQQQVPMFRVSSLINATADSLPEHAWISQLEYSNQKLVLVGQSSDPSDIVSYLKQQDLLQKAKLGSISNANAQEGVAQFDVSINLAEEVH